MPIYEYLCSRCNLKFEVMRPMSQAENGTNCPSCGHPARRTVSRFASFSKGPAGITAPIGGSAPSCSGCSATSCDTCH